jgi:glycosyltransferase involved in cell wall biosynthesis
MENKPSIGVIVLGMHRSGTSLMAGFLRILGVNLGDDLLAAQKSNEFGHFEHNGILQINEAILAKLGSSYDDVHELPQGWEQRPELIPFKKQLREIIERDFKQVPLFGIKEPRIGLLLPIYKEIFRDLGISLVFVIMKRKEIEILESLKTRNKFAFSKSLDLITKYRASIERYTKGEKKVYIAFDDLVNYPRFCMEKIQDALGIVLKPYDSFERDIIKFIDPRLKHHSLDDQVFLQELVRELDKLPRRDAEIQELKAAIEKLKVCVEEKNKAVEAVRANQERNRQALVVEYEKKREEVEARFRNKQELFQEKFQLYKDAVANERLLEQQTFVKEKDIELAQLTQLHRRQMDLSIRSQKSELHRLKKSHQKEMENFQLAREKEVKQLNASLYHERDYRKGVERSVTFKILRGYQKLVNAVMPEGWFLRRWYDSLIAWNQQVINGGLKKQPELALSATKNLEKFKGVDILFINHEESRTGAPRILFDIINYVGSHSSHRFAIVSKAQGSMHRELFQKYPDIIYPADVYIGISKFERAKRVLEATTPRLVYVNSLVAYEYAVEAKKLGIPVVFHVHELGSALTRVLNVQEREHFGDFADVVIAASHEVASHLINQTDCDPTKIKVIHEFIDVDRTVKAAQEPLEPTPFSAKEMVFIGMGTASRRKGTDLWFQAAKKVLAAGHDCTFIWVGEDLNQYPEGAQQKNDHKKIIFLGEKENPFPYLKRADALIMSSREDPFPLVVLEAMALGKPVIAFSENVGSKEVIDESTGSIVHETSGEALAKEIERFIDSAKERKTSALAFGPQKIRTQYDISVMLPRLSEVIDSYVGRNEKLPEPEKVVEKKSGEPDIFFIRGYAKSGTNWVGNLINLHPDLYAIGEFHLSRLYLLRDNLFPASQINSIRHEEIITKNLEAMAYQAVINGLREKTDKQVLMVGERTPEKIEPLAIRGKKIIWTIRDGRDVLISWVYHFLTVRLEKEDPLEKFPQTAKKRELFDGDKFYFTKNAAALLDDEAMVRYVASQWAEYITDGFASLEKARKGTLDTKIYLVKYESLHESTLQEAKNIYSFLGVNPDKATPLDWLTTPGFSEERPDFFYRKGVIGDWKNYFNENTRRWFKEEAGKTLIAAGYEPDLNW